MLTWCNYGWANEKDIYGKVDRDQKNSKEIKIQGPGS